VLECVCERSPLGGNEACCQHKVCKHSGSDVLIAHQRTLAGRASLVKQHSIVIFNALIINMFFHRLQAFGRI